jgi:ATP-dependent RNA helicase DeaD
LLPNGYNYWRAEREQQHLMTFEETGLKPEIVRAVSELGYVNPTPIQEKTIPHLLNATNDLVALAQTGTGKTAAFGLPVLHMIEPFSNEVQALILSPTRELAIQIVGDLTEYSKHLKGMNVVAVYGGASISMQIKELRRGAQIVVGTPGRVLDMINKGALKLQSIKYLVLDEADEMLNMGFKEDLDFILSGTPAEKRTLLFSATMPTDIARISKRYMNNPEEITVGSKNSGAQNVEHNYYVVSAKDRYEALKRIADLHPDIYGIVFCRTRRETREISTKLMDDGYNADALYGDLTQQQRDEVMARFRNRGIQLLVATDVAARGIDVDHLTHVINYELPDDLEAYIHRSGRTGRAGRSGISISIVHGRELYKVNQLERISGKTFNRKLVPNGEEIFHNKIKMLAQKLKSFDFTDDKLAKFSHELEDALVGVDRDQLIHYIMTKELGRFVSDYEQSRDVNLAGNERGERSSDRFGDRRGRDRDRERGGDREERFPREGARREGDFTRFHVNLGQNHKVNPARLMGLINENLPNVKVRIGKIEIKPGFSLVEVETQVADKLLKAFDNNVFFEDQTVSIKRDAQPAFSGAGGGGSFSGGGGDRYANRGGGSGGGRPERGASSDRGGSDRGGSRPPARGGDRPERNRYKTDGAAGGGRTGGGFKSKGKGGNW